MKIGELEFLPHEGVFNGRENALVAEKWITETKGIRVYDDYSVCSVGENNKMYWIQELTIASNGSVQVKDIGYQLADYFETI